MNPLLINPVFDTIGKVIDRIFPDKVAQASERAKADMALVALQQSGELELLSRQLQAIVAEAQSTDPWTSRARPTFLYVIYIMILMSVPMGFLSAFRPEIASAVAYGMSSWLKAIPDALYTLFGVGYLGYTGARGWEKTKKVAK